jgi:aminoglycoside phosphotransferase (APT) family kinase protein
VDGLVGALASVHACPGDGFDRIEPWFRPDALAVPAWADDPGPWRAAFAELATGVPAAPAGLVHRDLHPGNVLWARRRVTGIVDWVNAGSGSPAADLARCRANVAVLTDVATAETVLARYRDVTGRDLPDQRWWDLADLASIATQVVPGSSMLDAIVAGPAQLGIVLEPRSAGVALEELLRVALVS